MMRLNPGLVSIHTGLITRSMWVAPFLSAAFFHLFLAPGEALRSLPRLSPTLRACGAGLAGYLGAFALLYAAYQAYYGNWFHSGDASAAMTVSNWALLGIPLGLLAATRLHREQEKTVEGDWAALWLLAFLAAAVSAFGVGGFMRLIPERLMILLGLPLCLLSARALDRMRARRPHMARGFLAVIVAYGATSLLVASLCFQGPLGRRLGQGPFAYMHAEWMSRADADLMAGLEPGVVLAPAGTYLMFGDVAAYRPGFSTVIGRGTMDFSDYDWESLRARVTAFFDPKTPETQRDADLREWCVDYVYCPDTPPVDPAVLEQFTGSRGLVEVARTGQGAVFQVTDEE